MERSGSVERSHCLLERGRPLTNGELEGISTVHVLGTVEIAPEQEIAGARGVIDAPRHDVAPRAGGRRPGDGGTVGLHVGRSVRVVRAVVGDAYARVATTTDFCSTAR